MTKSGTTDAKQIGASTEFWDRSMSERNWLVYRLVGRDGKKPQKIPQAASDTNASAKVAAILTFDEAQEGASRLGESFGIGYLPRADSAVVCIDFDGVLNNGVVVQPDLPAFQSYAEVSPSGTGLHVLVPRPKDTPPLLFDDDSDWVGYIGSEKRFFTVSLDKWGNQSEILTDEALVKWVFDRHSGAIKEANASADKRRAEWGKLKRRQLGNAKHGWFHRLPVHLRAKCAAEMLAVLPPKYAKGYDTWLQAGMALRLADEEYELFEVWDQWSQTAPNYDGLNMEKWGQLAPTLDSEKRMVTLGTLVHWAKKFGWDPEPWERTARDHQLTDIGKTLRNSSGPAGDEKTKDTPLSPLAASKSLPPRGDRPIDLTRPRGAGRAADWLRRGAQQQKNTHTGPGWRAGGRQRFDRPPLHYFDQRLPDVPWASSCGCGRYRHRQGNRA